MSNYDAFDDNIKEQFGNYSPEVHPRIWENIIKEREKRRPVGFWFNFFNGRNILMLTAIIAAFSTGAWFLLHKSSSKKNITGEIAAQQNKTTVLTSAGEKNITQQQLPNTVASQPAILPGNSTINNSGNNGIADKTTAATGSFKIKTFAPFAENADENTIAKKARTKKTGTTINDYEDIDAGEVVNDNNPGDNFLNRILFTGLQKITAEKKSVTLAKRNLPDVFLPGCPAIEKNAAGNKSYIEAYGGPDLGFRNMTDTGNSAYLQKRKESTKFSSAYSAGLRYTHVFGNGMSIRTGINYSQINEKFTFVQGNLVQVTYIINAAGDTTGSYITTGTRYKTTHNKFKTIDVPLLIGYEMGNGKFHANINAGIIVNAYSWQKGEVLDMSNNPVSITTGKTTSAYQFKTNIGLGFTAGASMYYKLNEKIHILAEPYFRYNLSPMSKEKLTLTQKYNTAGLRVGLRVDLH
jgi:hypothetical protein